jgi:hypothetical protein
VSEEQRDALDALLRDAPLDLGGDVRQQREIFEQMMQLVPVPEDVAPTEGTLGGVPVVHIDVSGADPAHVIFYLHGGAYAIGPAGLEDAVANCRCRQLRFSCLPGSTSPCRGRASPPTRQWIRLVSPVFADLTGLPPLLMRSAHTKSCSTTC